MEMIVSAAKKALETGSISKKDDKADGKSSVL